MGSRRIESNNFLSKSNLRGNVWDKTEGKCWYCGIQTNPWRNFAIDHVVPITKGGSDDIDNLVPSCERCNKRKNNKGIDILRKMLAAEQPDNVSFTDAQLEFLRNNGIDTNLLKFKEYVFYFEKLEAENV